MSFGDKYAEIELVGQRVCTIFILTCTPSHFLKGLNQCVPATLSASNCLVLQIRENKPQALFLLQRLTGKKSTAKSTL